MKQFVRGAGVHISVTFEDTAGNIVTPTGASMTISFVPKNNTNLAGQRSFLTFAMIKNPAAGATDWIYDWDSSVAEPGIISCHVVTTTPNVPISSTDFSFRLTANRANREVGGDDWDGY